jgi:hypothetical protein
MGSVLACRQSSFGGRIADARTLGNNNMLPYLFKHSTKFKTMIEGDRFGPEDHRTRLKTEMAELLVIQTEFKRIFKLK